MSFLTDVCSIQYGYPFDSALFNSNDGTPLVRIRDVVPGFSNTYTTEKCDECYYVENDDMLIGMDGEFNIAYWKGGHAYLNQRVCKIIPKEGVHKRYLFYQLMPILKRIENRTAFVTVKHLSAKELNKIELSLPDFPRQQRIADTLDKVSEGITLCRKMRDELDLMVKAKFVEMFGTLPANELGWSTGTIRDCVTEVRYGSSRKAAEGDKGQYPYLRMNNITYDGELDLTDIKSIDIPDDELDKCSVRRGDVLFNRTNSRELVGKTCVYNRDELMVLAGFVVRVRANERMLPEFLSAFMNSTFTKRLLLSMCKTAIGQANINAQEFQNIEIYIPPITLQREFVDLKEQIDKSKLTIQGIRDKMEMEKLALMQEYFG